MSYSIVEGTGGEKRSLAAEPGNIGHGFELVAGEDDDAVAHITWHADVPQRKSRGVPAGQSVAVPATPLRESIAKVTVGVNGKGLLKIDGFTWRVTGPLTVTRPANNNARRVELAGGTARIYAPPPEAGAIVRQHDAGTAPFSAAWGCESAEALVRLLCRIKHKPLHVAPFDATPRGHGPRRTSPNGVWTLEPCDARHRFRTGGNLKRGYDKVGCGPVAAIANNGAVFWGDGSRVVMDRAVVARFAGDELVTGIDCTPLGLFITTHRRGRRAACLLNWDGTIAALDAKALAASADTIAILDSRQTITISSPSTAQLRLNGVVGTLVCIWEAGNTLKLATQAAARIHEWEIDRATSSVVIKSHAFDLSYTPSFVGARGVLCIEGPHGERVCEGEVDETHKAGLIEDEVCFWYDQQGRWHLTHDGTSSDTSAITDIAATVFDMDKDRVQMLYNTVVDYQVATRKGSTDPRYDRSGVSVTAERPKREVPAKKPAPRARARG